MVPVEDPVVVLDQPALVEDKMEIDSPAIIPPLAEIIVKPDEVSDAIIPILPMTATATTGLSSANRSVSPRPLLFPFPESQSNETIFASTSKPRSRSNRPPSSTGSSTSTQQQPIASTSELPAESMGVAESNKLSATPAPTSTNRSKRSTSSVARVETYKEEEVVEEEIVEEVPISRTRSTRGSQRTKKVEPPPQQVQEEEDDEEEGGDGGITRCVCSTDSKF